MIENACIEYIGMPYIEWGKGKVEWKPQMLFLSVCRFFKCHKNDISINLLYSCQIFLYLSILSSKWPHSRTRSHSPSWCASEGLDTKPAAFDITVTSPLTPAILAEASRRVGAAAEAAENRKHTANDPKCAELGWRCVPLAVETYCNWGEEARKNLHSTGHTLGLWLFLIS